MKIKFLLLTFIVGILFGCNSSRYSHQSDYADSVKETEVEESLKSENYFGSCAVKYDQVYLNSNPSFPIDEINSINKGQAVFPLEKETDKWVFVQTTKGNTGWVGKSWIDCSDSEEEYNVKAFEKTISLAKQGNSAAQFLICKAYDVGKNVQKDLETAYSFCSLAAEQGHTEAQFFLGSMYEHGDGVVQDDETSAYWYRQAAEGGGAQAQYALGVYYYHGKGVPKDHHEMMLWWEKAAAQEHKEAQEWLDVLYQKMLKDGIKAFDEGNFEWAFTLLEPVAKKRFPEAQVKLGQMYENGNYVNENDEEAVKWFKLAAMQGHADGTFMLGKMYMLGHGTPGEDRKEQGTYLIMLAAAQGSPIAKEVVEKIIYKGDQIVDYGYDQNATLTLVHKPTTDQYGKKWYWSNHVVLVVDDHDKLKIDPMEIEFYNIEDCARGLRGVKQGTYHGKPMIVPEAKVEMMAVRPGDKVHAFVCGSSNQETTPPSEISISTGTGWLMPNGYVATNYHVVDGHSVISLVDASGEKHKATLASKDINNDLALLKMENQPSNMLALPIAEHSGVAGEDVFAIGFPHPDLMGREVKITSGIISSTKGLNDDPRMLQISVPVQAGNSGGPLLNSRGKVVGIITSKLKAVKIFDITGDLPQNVNYAIKVNHLETLSEGLERLPTRSFGAIDGKSISDIMGIYKSSVFIVFSE